MAIISLLTQNGLLALSSVAMGLMFYFQLNVCLNVIAFGILTTVVIIFVSGANLATVANTISIEKDWVVALADGNKDTLAGIKSLLLLWLTVKLTFFTLFFHSFEF